MKKGNITLGAMQPMRFYIENLGCAKNQVDAENMIGLLVANGWQYEQAPENADVIIVNSCGFIQEAKEESIEVSLGFKKKYPGKKVIMAGCLSERYGADLQESLYELDGFVGNKHPGEILGLIEQVPRKQLLSLPGSAYVKIAEGCSNNCSYCSIPLIRGSLESRTIGEITMEIEALVAQGIVEFNLVAQDLGSFGSDRTDGTNIGALFKAIARLPHTFWIRPLYIHPDKFPHAILDVMTGDPRFLPYFDLPFQHAADGILKKMGRKGSSAQYLDLIACIRGTLPHAVMRSTFLVGFPGETKEDFRALEKFQTQAALDWLGVFTYSREEDTPAYAFPGQVGKKTAQARKSVIEENQVSITEKQLDRFVGRELDVLVEEAIRNEKFYIGRSYAQAPEVDGLIVIHGENLPLGRIIKCKIIKRNGVDLEAVFTSFLPGNR